MRSPAFLFGRAAAVARRQPQRHHMQRALCRAAARNQKNRVRRPAMRSLYFCAGRSLRNWHTRPIFLPIQCHRRTMRLRVTKCGAVRRLRLWRSANARQYQQREQQNRTELSYTKRGACRRCAARTFAPGADCAFGAPQTPKSLSGATSKNNLILGCTKRGACQRCAARIFAPGVECGFGAPQTPKIYQRRDWENRLILGRIGRAIRAWRSVLRPAGTPKIPRKTLDSEPRNLL